MKKFCCTLPNCNRSYDTQRGLYYHKIRDPMHNRNISYTSRNIIGNKRHSPIISNETDYNPEDNSRKKSITGPTSIDTAIMSNVMEADDEKFTGEDVEKIIVENVEVLSRNADDLLSVKKNIAEDEDETIGDDERC